MFLEWNRRLQPKDSSVFDLGIRLPSPSSRRAACGHCGDGLLDSFTFPKELLKCLSLRIGPGRVLSVLFILFYIAIDIAMVRFADDRRARA